MFTVWGRPNCVWCSRVKSLLTKHGYEFTYHNITEDNVEEFVAKHPDWENRPPTVPQVWYGNQWVGGYEDTERLIKALPKQ